jgi:hypothetical protein
LAQPSDEREALTKPTTAFARVRLGRIVEVRVRRLADPSDVDLLNASVFAAMRNAGPGAVICADYRGASPLSRDVAQAWSRAMRIANRGIARSALLLDPSNALFNLQIERVVHCAGNPTRRLFADVNEFQDWVGKDLTLAEREAVLVFLSDDAEPPSIAARGADDLCHFALGGLRPAEG